uniref:Uncharacterized protein n=1 Tax=Rhodnius prolixus TaxID=13249 RepID=T1H8Q8_RHOPR
MDTVLASILVYRRVLRKLDLARELRDGIIDILKNLMNKFCHLVMSIKYFWRRRQLVAKPLLQEGGVASIILENPFYGYRKPKNQVRSILHHVSDIFVMGGCLMMEAIVLFHWCRRHGLGPLGVTGISMGGHGVMSRAIEWKLLRHQYQTVDAYRCQVAPLLQRPVQERVGNVNQSEQVGQQSSPQSEKPLDLSVVMSAKRLKLEEVFHRRVLDSQLLPSYVNSILGLTPNLG